MAWRADTRARRRSVGRRLQRSSAARFALCRRGGLRSASEAQSPAQKQRADAEQQSRQRNQALRAKRRHDRQRLGRTACHEGLDEPPRVLGRLVKAWSWSWSWAADWLARSEVRPPMRRMHTGFPVRAGSGVHLSRVRVFLPGPRAQWRSIQPDRSKCPNNCSAIRRLPAGVQWPSRGK